MYNIILYNPQIPQNTGNIARTCAVTGIKLHLIKPYGFIINNKNLKRAGLDYWDDVTVLEYDSFEDFELKNVGAVVYPVTTKGQNNYTQQSYSEDAYFLFGSETSGLPDYIHEKYYSTRIRIPMRENERCLNLSNSVAVIAYEALRQNNFKNLV